MASQVQSTEIAHTRRASSSEDDVVREKITPVPSYNDASRKNDGNIETTDVKYGTGIEEKDIGGSQSSVVGDNEEEREERSWLSKIWRKYKPVFHAFFVLVMTG